MRTLRSLVCPALLLVAGAAAAQGRDASVLPAGAIGVRAQGDYGHYDAVYGPGGTAPLLGRFNRPVGLADIPGAAALPAGLQRFFDLTSAATGDPTLVVAPADLAVGTPDLAGTADIRRAVVGVDVGVLPRINIGIRLPFVGSRVEVQRFGVESAQLGRNPDPQGNAQRLARIDPALEALGKAALLPRADSPLGIELQRRAVAALGADSLQLPPALTGADLAAILAGEGLGFRPIGEREPWALGDVEVEAKVQWWPAKGIAGEGVRFRGAVTAGAVLPTGATEDPSRLVQAGPSGGHSGAFVRSDNDVFVGRRLWATVSAGYLARREVTVQRRIADEGALFPPIEAVRELRWNPGSVLELTVQPRVQLVDPIYVSAGYRLLRGAGERYTVAGDGAATVDLAAATRQEWSAGVVYSAIPERAEEGAAVPFEAFLLYSRAFAGAGGAPAARSLLVGGRLYVRLWGRATPPAAD